MKSTRKTIFCDIDGTLLKHIPPSDLPKKLDQTLVLPETLQKIKYWDSQGYDVILTTGRRESLRKITEKQLLDTGIVYDKLLMGLGPGERIIINDKKADGTIAAWAMTPQRNSGIGEYNFSNLSEISKQYFYLFSSKDIKGIQKLFAKDIVLEDWEGRVVGYNNVSSKVLQIFHSVENLNVEIKSISHVNNTTYGEIIVQIDSQQIPVLDVISYDAESKISYIKAYRCA